MSWIYYNPNPDDNLVGDCVIRALTLALNKDWNQTYLAVSTQGYEIKDMPSSNETWGACLRRNGFKRFIIPNECPDCYTISDFCRDHSYGLYVLATGTHVVTCIDGDYYDTWDSGKKIPNQILQYLLNTNQITQDQVNRIMQMRNDPQMQQLMR